MVSRDYFFKAPLREWYLETRLSATGTRLVKLEGTGFQCKSVCTAEALARQCRPCGCSDYRCRPALLQPCALAPK